MVLSLLLSSAPCSLKPLDRWNPLDSRPLTRPIDQHHNPGGVPGLNDIEALGEGKAPEAPFTLLERLKDLPGDRRVEPLYRQGINSLFEGRNEVSGAVRMSGPGYYYNSEVRRGGKTLFQRRRDWLSQKHQGLYTDLGNVGDDEVEGLFHR